MLVQTSDMRTVCDEYKLAQVTDNNDAITTTCLQAAQNLVLGYLAPRYDVQAILAIPSDAPELADLLEIIKDIALYKILRRHNVDIAYQRVVESYKMHIEYLTQVSAGKVRIVGLPAARDPITGKENTTIEMGSKKKRDWDY